MVSLLFAGIKISSCTGRLDAKVADPGGIVRAEKRPTMIGIVAGFKSERWPVIDRNAGRLQLGIRRNRR